MTRSTQTRPPAGRNRGNAGQFTSRTATRTVVDEERQATVQELPDGGKLISSPASVQELPGGVRIITAPQAPGSEETDDAPLREPVIFTNPTSPNATMAGTLFKIGSGKWMQLPRRYLRFVNGHCAARTRRDAERIRSNYRLAGTGAKNPEVWEEPAPLLNDDEAAARGLTCWKFFDDKGRIAFWTYHPDAYMAFQRAYRANVGA